MTKVFQKFTKAILKQSKLNKNFNLQSIKINHKLKIIYMEKWREEMKNMQKSRI